MAPEEEFSALRDIFFADLGGKFTVFANSLVITAKKLFIVYRRLVKQLF